MVWIGGVAGHRDEKTWRVAGSFLAVVALLVLAVSALSAQPPAPKTQPAKIAPPPPPPPDEIVPPAPLNPVEPAIRGVAGAAQVAGTGNGLSAAALVVGGVHFNVWDARPAYDPYIDPEELPGIEQFRDFRRPNPMEAQAYRYVLLHAKRVPASALAKAVRKDLTYTHLKEEPQKYRGAVRHLDGKLKSLTRYDAPQLSWRDGIRYIYEAFIFVGEPAKLHVVVLSEIPAGLEAEGKLGSSVDVSLDAYFFKQYAFEGEDGKKHAAPLFIGRTLSVAAVGPEEVGSGSISQSFLYLGAGSIVALIALVVGLNWLFRRGDQATRYRLNQTRTLEFIQPTEPPAAPKPDEPSHHFPAPEPMA